MSPLKIAVLCCGLVGCGIHHSPRNAPGNIDLLAPPPKPGLPPKKLPTNPGGEVIVLGAGPSGGYSVKRGFPSPTKGTLGAEGMALYQISHNNSGTLMPEGTYLGLGAGLLAAFHPEGVKPRAFLEFRPVLNIGSLLFFGAGWLVEPHGHHGPQFTLSAGGLYFRVANRIDQGTDVELGFAFDLPWFSWRESY